MSEEKVKDFMSITGGTEDIAKSLLSACNDSLEMAINMHMEGLDTTTNGIEEEVRAPIPQKKEVLVESFEPIHPGTSSGKRHRKSLVRSVFDGFRNFREESESYAKGKKKKTLEDLFKPPLDIIFRGGFSSARDFASLSKKWLLVNIQDPMEFTCQTLNRDVWSSERVKKSLKKSFVFWQQYKDADEAQPYMMYYPITKWPYVAIIDPRTGEKMVEWNNLDEATFIDLSEIFLDQYKGSLVSEESPSEPLAKKKCVEEPVSILDANEDDQLAMAIKASLESTKESSELNTLSDDSEEEEHNQKLSEPVVENWEDFLGSEEDSLSSLMIRFPCGKREVKAFPSTSKLKALTLYIASLGYSLKDYEIVTNFPRRIVSGLDIYMSLKDHDLFPQETIFIQKL